MKFFGFKQYLNKIKLFSFVLIHSAPVISTIFNLNREDQTGMEQNMNGTEKIKPELMGIRTIWQGHDFQSHPCLF